MTPAQANRKFAEQIGVAEHAIRQPIVALELPSGQEGRDEAVSAFVFAANILARLFPRLYLIAPDAPVGVNAWGLRTLSDLVAHLDGVSEGRIAWGAPPAKTDIVVGIGAPAATRAARMVFASFGGWAAALDQTLDSREPGMFGGLLAACYAAAQAFLHAVALAGGNLPLIRPFQLSLLDYAASGRDAPSPREVDLGTVHLVGVGAVGSAMVYALAQIPLLTGTLYLIDNDRVDESNLNRYVLMRKVDVARAKTEVAEDALRKSRLVVLPYDVSFEVFRRTNSGIIDLLVTPVDSEAGRRALAKHLPRSVLNAATGGSTVTISRHGFADGKACLHCLYLPPIEYVTTEMRLAKDLGLSVEEVETLLANNTGVSGDCVRRVELHRGLPSGSLESLIGQQVQSFYQRAVCSTAPISVGTTTIISPLSFISAAAGVLLAAELVKCRTPELSGYRLNNYFRFDTLAAPNPSFRQMKRQDASGRCICVDRDYVEVYQERFGVRTFGP